jgi:hypothetical protein
MANISCTCGHVFLDGQIPCPHEYTIIPDANIETLSDSILALIERGGDVEAELGFLISSHGKATYKCPSCKRLLIFENGLNTTATIYKKE